MKDTHHQLVSHTALEAWQKCHAVLGGSYDTLGEAKFLILGGLREDFLDDFAMIQFKPAAAGHLQSMGVEPKEVKSSGMDVGNIMPVLHGVEPDLIGGSVGHSAFDAGSSEKG